MIDWTVFRALNCGAAFFSLNFQLNRRKVWRNISHRQIITSPNYRIETIWLPKNSVEIHLMLLAE